MTLTQLECFVAVARERHFRRASEGLDRTQPAVSLQIQKLEGDLGLTLLNRSGAHVSLTGSGEMFLPYAERILSESKLAMLQMEEIRGGPRERIRIGALPTVAAHFLPAVLVRFRSVFPDVELTLREEKLSTNLIARIESNDIDIALALDGSTPAGIGAWPLLKEELCVAVAQNHTLAARSHVSSAQLRRERFITYKSPGHQTREATFAICRAAGFEPAIALESEEVETIQYFVAANLGIAILPEMVLQRARPQGLCVLHLEDDIPRRTITIYQKTDRFCSRSLTQFIAMIKEAAIRVPASEAATPLLAS
jgi:DNA-binding transcriptional LysR family regulator